MESISLSSLVSPHRFSAGRRWRRHLHHNHRSTAFFPRTRPPRWAVLAIQRDDDNDDHPTGSSNNSEGEFSGRLVDQSMLTLRKRMCDIREAEGLGGEVVDGANTENKKAAAAVSLESRKHDYTIYHSEFLQVLALMQLDAASAEERPRVAIGMTVMVTLKVPVSVLVVALHLMDAAKVIMDGINGAGVSLHDK